MLFGNSERSLFDELWLFWHSEQPVNLEAVERSDLWKYENKKPSCPPSLNAEAHFNFPTSSQS